MQEMTGFVRRTLFVALASSLLWFAACGPSEGTDSDDAGGADVADTSEDEMDTGVDTGEEDTGGTGDDTEMDTAESDPDTGGDTGDTDPDTGDAEPTLVMAVSTTDSTPNSTSTTVRTVVDFSSGTVADDKTYQTGDMILDKSAGRLFAADRRCSQDASGCSQSAGTVIEFDVAADGTLNEARTLELPDGIYNPYGAAVAENQGLTFAVSYQTSDAYQFSSSGKPDTTLDLSPFDKGNTGDDNDPEAADVAVDGDYVYFLMQRLSGFSATENSALAGYDLSSGSFLDFDSGTSGTQALDLQAKNAVAIRTTPNGTWTAGLKGSFGTLDGEIAKLSDEGSGILSVDTTVVTEQQLDGDILNFAFTGEETGVAVVLKNGVSKAVKFDASGSSVQTTELRSLGGFSSALCLTPDRSEVWVAETSMSSGSTFVGYDPSTGSELQKTGPSVDNTLPYCQFIEVSN